MEKRTRPQRAFSIGFALAPILYIIALAGIAGSVLFTGYTQVLRSNVEITADNSVRNQIRMAAEVLAAQASVNNTLQQLAPPTVAAFATLDAARLPKNASGAAAITESTVKGAAESVGGVPTSGGVRQLDPWGRHYIMCRWVGSTGGAQTDPSFALLSAGADGNLATTCNDAQPAAGSDDRMEFLTVANVLARSANWQQQAGTFTFGIDPNASRVAVGIDSASVDTSRSLDIGGDGRFRGNLLVNQGLTVAGATNLAGLSAGTTTLGATTLSTLNATSVTASGGLIGGTLAVSGASTLGAVTGGAATFTSTNGGALSGSTLNLTGLATLAAGLSVTGATTLGPLTAGTTTLGATSATSVATGDLTATGATSLASATVIGNAVIGGTATATGGFIGNLTGNVTGNVSGNVSGSAGSVDGANITGTVPISAGGTGATTASGARTNLGLAIGTNVQGWDSDLQALADATATGFIRRTGSGTVSIGPILNAEVPTFTGASAGSSGSLGGVPVPAAGQQTFLLRGDGTWFNPGSLSVGSIGQGDSGVGVSDTGAGLITFTIDGFEQARITGTPNADRSVRLTGGNAGGNIPPELGAYSAAPNSPLRIASQGTGDLILRTNGIDRLTINGATGITAGSFSGPLAGNATTATTLATARNFSLTGDATATATSFNGGADVALATSVVRLQGRPVAATAPNSNEALVWNGTAWAPGPAGTPDGGTLGSATGVDIRLKDGTAAAPGLTFAQDLDTGLYRIGADVLGVATGALERVRVIGTTVATTLRITAPGTGTAEPALQLNDSAGTANNKLVELASDNGALTLRSLNDDTTVKATRLTMDNQGRFGLGVSNPTQLLHLAGVLRFDTNTLVPCDGNAAGSLRWGGSGMEYCDGGGTWQGFAPAAGGGGGGGGGLAIYLNGALVGYVTSITPYGGGAALLVNAINPTGTQRFSAVSTNTNQATPDGSRPTNLLGGSSNQPGGVVGYSGANCTGTAYFLPGTQYDEFDNPFPYAPNGNNTNACHFTCTGAAACQTQPRCVAAGANQSGTAAIASHRPTSGAPCQSGYPYNTTYPHAAPNPAQAALIALMFPSSSAVRLAVDASGGGGATLPAGNNSEIQFNDGGAWGADDQFVWDKTNDRLGIGTTPTEALDIAAASGVSVLRLANNVGGAAIRLNANNSANAANELVIGGAAANGNFSAVAQATDAVVSAEQRDLVLTARNATGNIDFATGATETVKMTLANNGRLGIGVTTPTQLLHLASGALRFTADSATTCDANAVGSIRFNGTDFEQCKAAGSWAALASGGGGGGLDIVVVTGSGAATATATCPADRRVLFATCSPSGYTNDYPSNPGDMSADGRSVTCKANQAGYAAVQIACVKYQASSVGGGATPAGADQQIQFNDAGAWGADALFVFDKTNDILSVGGSQLSGPGFFMLGSSNVGALGMTGSAAAANRTAINITGTAITGAISNLALRTNNADRLIIDNNGTIGIGTTSPAAKLDVQGDIVSRANAAGATTSIDWSTGNVQHVSASCGSFSFTNMRDGGSYSLIVKGTTAATCSFAHAGLTIKMPPGHGATSAGTHTIYTFIRAGTDVYVTWIKGY